MVFIHFVINVFVSIITWSQRKSSRRIREPGDEGGGPEGGGGWVSEKEKWLFLLPYIASNCLSESVDVFPTLSLFSVTTIKGVVTNKITYLQTNVFASFSSLSGYHVVRLEPKGLCYFRPSYYLSIAVCFYLSMYRSIN